MNWGSELVARVDALPLPAKSHSSFPAQPDVMGHWGVWWSQGGGQQPMGESGGSGAHLPEGPLHWAALL